MEGCCNWLLQTPILLMNLMFITVANPHPHTTKEPEGIQCPPVHPLPYGIIISEGPYYVGDIITFDCSLGYEIIGADEAECLQDGAWSDEVPQCSKVESGCDAPGARCSQLGDGVCREVCRSEEMKCPNTDCVGPNCKCCKPMEPHWCAFVDTRIGCSDSMIAESCKKMCPGGMEPLWCVYIDSRTGCSDPMIAESCKRKCPEGLEPQWCAYIDSYTGCSNTMIQDSCKNLCSVDHAPDGSHSNVPDGAHSNVPDGEHSHAPDGVHSHAPDIKTSHVPDGLLPPVPIVHLL